MKNLIKLLKSAGIVLALLSALAGCSRENSGLGTSGSETSSEETNSETVVIVDGNGERLRIKKPVNRVIVEYTDNAELVRILNRRERIIGISGYDYIFEKCLRQFPEIRKKPTVGLFWKLDYEAILGLKPDILLTFGADTSEKKDKLPGVNVVFLGLYYPDLINPAKSSFVRGVKNLGKILDAEEKSEKYLGWYLGLINKITSGTAELAASEKPDVFITSYPHVDLNTGSFSIYPKRDALTQASHIAGGNDIAESLPQFTQGGKNIKIGLEWVLKKDPDILIMHAVDRVDLYGYETDDPSGIAKALDYIMSRPELQGLKAVKNRQVYLFDGHFRNDASGGIVAAAYMAKIFHPELFADINPEAVQQEYLNMQGLDYDLNMHGVFLYPPLVTGDDVMGIPDNCIKRFSDGID